VRAEDWPRVEELFHNVSQLGVAERDEYLARECAGDESLRREVELMIAASESNPTFMERPLLSQGLRSLYGRMAESLVGRSLGHYKITRMLDSGGMGGEVYLAEDCRLERPVALKFISNHYAGDDWAREQMMKEARAVARLEHPHICQVYGVEEIEGYHFIVMQYVEGETLASLMKRARLGVERAAELAEQIAGALAFAHARRVIHRDVKPQNIMVTAEGEAKVLDYGLAKFVRPQRVEEAGGEDPEQTLHLGDVVGTPAYMSPEQARGEELDFRSDIYSFGVVLYEMLSGRNPFLRETVEETVLAIRDDDAPPLLASHNALWEITRQCLAKERGRRPESADLLARRLRVLRAARDGIKARPSTARQHFGRYARRYAAVAVALVLLLSTLSGYIYLKLSQIHTLAVLPITNESEDREADYLSVGLTRSLSDKFSYLPRLKLKLPSVVPSSQGKVDDLAKFGRELEADAVLSGRVFKQGGSLRFHISLFSTPDASLLWEDTFELSNAASVFTLQDKVVREVSSRLDLWLPGSALYRRQTDNAEALKLYMRGRYLWSRKRDKENIQEAIRLFERAVELDHSFAKAYTGLADCYVLTANVLYGPMPTGESMEKARYNARQALALDDSLPETHTSMGVIRMQFDWDWIEAEREFKRAIELDPDYAEAHYWYTGLLAARGRFDEALRESETARALDPYSPLANMNYARALYYARRSGEAEAYLRQKIEERPGVPQLKHMLGYVLLQQERIDDAIAIFEKLPPERRLYSAAALGYSYGRAGREDDALRMLGELDEFSKTKFVPPFEKALVYIGMGWRDEAFALLNKSYELRFPNLTDLAVEPAFDVIRDDPRFADLTRRLNLTP